MKYKLITMDIDGTLISSQGVMTKETVGAIRKCMEAGVMVTISSGRSIQGVRSFIDGLSSMRR